jgi:HEPN domain
MLPIDEVADVLVCFHAQQAVEKALKAVLAARGVEFAHRHDLRALMGQCENAGVRLPEELAGVDLLSPYAAELRYDDDRVHAVKRETASRWRLPRSSGPEARLRRLGVDRSPQLSPPKPSMVAERRGACLKCSRGTS